VIVTDRNARAAVTAIFARDSGDEKFVAARARWNVPARSGGCRYMYRYSTLAALYLTNGAVTSTTPVTCCRIIPLGPQYQSRKHTDRVRLLQKVSLRKATLTQREWVSYNKAKISFIKRSWILATPPEPGLQASHAKAVLR